MTRPRPAGRDPVAALEAALARTLDENALLRERAARADVEVRCLREEFHAAVRAILDAPDPLATESIGLLALQAMHRRRVGQVR